jgi:two-component system chemotaxis sensor kinase CheA
VGIDKIDQLINMVGELVITQSMLGEIDGDGPVDVARLARLREGLGQLARNTRALQDSVMRLRSMPISVLFHRFPRLVRELGERLGKDIAMEIVGQNTELDKAVLEKLGDPLVHLVRNSIDHGIEPAAERIAAGKPQTGTIRLSAEHRGGDVVVEISDDGRGLDRERIVATARQRGLVAPDTELDDRAAMQLVFLPGLSTAREVTEVSGRGVGMDVVRRHIEDLGGEIALESRPGAGTRITLRLPLTLAIIDGQLIRLGEHQFVIPLLSIIESVAIENTRSSRLAGACDVYRLRDQLIPMIDLAALLGMPRRSHTDRRVMVVVAAEGAQLGFVVDELMAQQQVVVKSLETNYQRVSGLAGATILGDGRVAFILDVVALGHAARARIATAA